ncbi:hypothetical protein ABBQ32_003822 [Trebouxia sp. C0010 RCD-2024]
MSFDSDDGDEPPEAVALGFLGAGKTTLVHHILNTNHKHRIAVIVNEYGDSSGIESAAISVSGKDNEVVPAEEWVELANGCLCCSVKNDFVAALEGLMLKRNKFDYILIETTGLADPGPVAAALWTDDELEAAVHLDAIVTVVDAKNIQQQLQQQGSGDAANEAQKQIAYADTVLLNKIDLLPSEQAVKTVEAAIHQHNSTVTILHTMRCTMDVAQLLDQGAFMGSSHPPSLEAVGQVLKADIADQSQASGSHGAQLAKPDTCGNLSSCGGHGKENGAGQHAQDGSAVQHQHSHPGHSHYSDQHDSSVRSVSITQPGQVDMVRLKDWLDSLLWDKGSPTQDIYRMKGLLKVAGSPKAHVLQAVHELYDVVPGIAWSDLPVEQQQQNKVVLIGRNLDIVALQAGFKQTAMSQ